LKDSPAERFQGFFSGFDCNGYKKTAGLFVRANKDKVRKACYHDLVKSKEPRRCAYRFSKTGRFDGAGASGK
jgi:hypothetical protein